MCDIHTRRMKRKAKLAHPHTNIDRYKILFTITKDLWKTLYTYIFAEWKFGNPYCMLTIRREKSRSVKKKKPEIEMLSWLTIGDFWNRSKFVQFLLLLHFHSVYSLPIEASYIGLFELKSNLFTVLCSAATIRNFYWLPYDRVFFLSFLPVGGRKKSKWDRKQKAISLNTLSWDAMFMSLCIMSVDCCFRIWYSNRA